MKKVDLNQVLVNFKGEPYKDAEGKELTLANVCAEAIVSDKTGGKMKLYNLGKRVFEGGVIEMDNADFVLMKQALENCPSYQGSPIILGQAMDLLSKVE